MDHLAGKKGINLIGDGYEAIAENVDVDLIYVMFNIMDKYYPRCLSSAIALDLPPFFNEIMITIFSHLNNWIFNIADFINYTRLSEILDENVIPAHKKSLFKLKT